MKSRIGLWVMLIVLVSGIGYVAYLIFNDSYYNVRFDVNGGSKVENIRVEAKDKIYSLPIVSRDGYEFKGWYLDDELFDLNSPVTEDITLKAVWQENKSKSLVLKFDTLGGEEIADIEILEGGLLSDVPTPSKEGYKFVGWYYYNKVVDFSEPINSDMILVAKWKKSSVD